MVEYLYNAIRAVAGQEIVINAMAVNPDETLITANCSLVLHIENGDMIKVDGVYLEDGQWEFRVPAEATAGLTGRHWYCIQHEGANLCFKEPIYLV